MLLVMQHYQPEITHC